MKTKGSIPHPQYVVVGSSGFVGRALVASLRISGFEVIEVDLDGDISFDICDPTSLRKADIRPGARFVHLAALPDVRSCRESPYLAIRVNLGGLANVLALAGEKQASSFLFASSEWVYSGLGPSKSFREDEIIDLAKIPNLYGRTKLLGEQLLSASDLSFPAVSCRFGIVYGPRKQPGSAVESILSSVLRNETVEVGSGASARSFIHIDDLVGGITAASNLEHSAVVNIAGKDALSLMQIFEAAKLFAPQSSSKFLETGAKPDIRGCDVSLAEKLLGWSPTRSIFSGFKEIAEYE